MVVLDLEFNAAVVILSTGVAFIGAFAAVSLCEQYRLSTLSQSSTNRIVLMIFVAVSLGGVGIWAMHYIAISSFVLKLHGERIPVRYNYTYLFLSLALVNVMEFLGLYCASTDSCFNKSKNEIMEIFVQRASTKYSMAELKQMGKLQILRIVFTHSLDRIVFGGVIAGGGVALMHYLGMMSMEFQGTIKYDAGLVVLSVLVAIGAVIGGFWIFFRILSVFPSLDILRVACALNGMFSLSGVHYIGLVSATFDYDPNMKPPETSKTIDSDKLLIGVVTASVVFCVITHVYVLSDLRGWLLKTSTQLRQADALIVSIHSQRSTPGSTHTATAPAPSRDVLKYLRRYNRDGNAASTVPNSNQSSVALYNDYAEEDDSSDRQQRGISPNGSVVGTVEGGKLAPTQEKGAEDDERVEQSVTIKPTAALRTEPRAGSHLSVATTDGRGRPDMDLAAMEAGSP